MKKLLSTLFVLVAFVAVALAQTPEQIVSRMEAAVEQHDNEGVIMTVDAKIMLGTMSTKTYTRGGKTRMEVTMLGIDIITWTEGSTVWEYNSKTNSVEIKTIEALQGEESESDIEMFKGITEGYDVAIDKETAQEWSLLCTKSKSNTSKDAPKKIELVIAKGTYMPVSLKTKMDGVTVTMRDISFGVTEEEVTFNAANFPGVTIEDKRQ